MTGHIKVNGVWQNITAPSVKIAGTWKQVIQAWTKVGGSWVQWYISTITDTFTRTNTASGLGTSDSGSLWSAIRGVWFINNGTAKSTDTPSTYPIATVDAGVTAPTILADVDAAGGTGIAFWVTDTQNWWGLNSFTNTNTSYSQYCATYSQGAAAYSCGVAITGPTYGQTCATYNQTGPFYSCGVAPTGPNYGQTCPGGFVQTGPFYSCGQTLGPNYGQTCPGGFTQTGPFYSCGQTLGPNYGQTCSGGVYGPTYSFSCSSFRTGYDGLRGFYYSQCASFVQTGPSYFCPGGFTQTGPFYSCGQALGPNYGQTCSGGYTQTGPFYSCGQSVGPNYGQSCSGGYTQTGPFYSCSQTLGPSYGQTCATYSQTGPSYSCSQTNGPFYSANCATYTQQTNLSAGSVALRLIKSVANTVTTVVEQTISSLPASLKVAISGTSITAQAFSSSGGVNQLGSNLTNSPSSPTVATTHGIILGPGGFTQGTTVDNITISS